MNLNRLTTAQGWLQSLRPLPSDVTEELRHRYEVALTHHSTAIEGNTLTQSETQIVIEKGITIAGKSVVEHLEVVGHKEALDFVYGLAGGHEPITSRVIREIHSLVMAGQGNGYGDLGRYRTLDVRAAGTDYAYPSHVKVPELMEEFEQWMIEGRDSHPVNAACEAHLRFVTIHPFRDGNGRVGRLLLNLILLRHGYPIAVLRADQRAEYIEAIQTAQTTGIQGPLQAMVYHAVAASLGDTFRTAMSSASVVVEPSVKADVLEWLSEQGV